MLPAAPAKQNPHAKLFHDLSVWARPKSPVNHREDSPALLESSSAMPAIKLVVFDIAGTIIEDHGEVLRAYSLALNKSGIPFTEDELKERKGASKREVIRYFVERRMGAGSAQTNKMETAYDCFRSELQNLYADSPYRGSGLDFFLVPRTRHPDRDNHRLLSRSE